MPDLNEWLLEQVAEDERVAKRAQARARRFLKGDRPWERAALADATDPLGQLAQLANPARVLAECEAKRRIIEAFERVRVLDYLDYGDDASFNIDLGKQSALIDVMRLEALPYADRPGFQPEWTVCW